MRENLAANGGVRGWYCLVLCRDRTVQCQDWPGLPCFAGIRQLVGRMTAVRCLVSAWFRAATGHDRAIAVRQLRTDGKAGATRPTVRVRGHAAAQSGESKLIRGPELPATPQLARPRSALQGLERAAGASGPESPLGGLAERPGKAPGCPVARPAAAEAATNPPARADGTPGGFAAR